MFLQMKYCSILKRAFGLIYHVHHGKDQGEENELTQSKIN